MEFINNHSNKTYLSIQEWWRSFFSPGNFHTTTWPVPQMCKPEHQNPEWGHGIHHQGFYELRTDLWLRYLGVICCQPISELCTVCCSAQKAKSVGCFLLVPNWVLSHQTKKLKFLLKHNFQKPIYQSFITIIRIHQLIKSSVYVFCKCCYYMLLHLIDWICCKVYWMVSEIWLSLYCFYWKLSVKL